MKAFKTLLLLLALGLSVYGQAVNVTANKLKGSATAPSGACSAQQVQLTTAGVVYVCASGTWTSSGGGTTINSTNGQVPYRVNSTTFGDSAISSNALSATGISVTSAAAGSGVTVGVTSSGSNESLILAAKGTTGLITDNGSSPVNFNGLLVGSQDAASYTSGQFRYRSPGGASALGIFTNTLALGSGFKLTWGNSTTGWSSQDTGFERLAAAVIRVTNASTGAGSLIVGTSTDTADAQLSVYSQSTTRPSLKLRALSGTASGQNVFESYNASGTLTTNITSGGAATFAAEVISGSYFLSTGSQGWIWTTGAFSARTKSGSGLALGASTPLAFTQSNDSNDTIDLTLWRDAANTLAQRNGNADQIARSYGANSGYWERGSISESITLSTSGATTDSTADLLPANSIIEAVTARITTTITTATDWALGDATTAARFAAANSTLTSGTTSVGLQHVDQTGAAGPKQTSAAKLRITTTGTPGAGVIRVTVYYRKFVPPTS